MSLNDTKFTEQILEKLPASANYYGTFLKEKFLAAQKSTQYAITGSALFAILLLFNISSRNSDFATAITFEARRGNLEIAVLEGGTLEALQSQEIRSRIKGREGVKILNIVEEGYQVTQEDVEEGLVLVELDKASLIDQQLNQEIAVETAEATSIERRAQFEIQLNENMTELNEARQGMRFGLLEFEKFLGADLVAGIIAQLEIEERLARVEAADLATVAAPLPFNDSSLIDVSEERVPRPSFDLTDMESLPAPLQERIEQMIAENGGELPSEMLERMQQFGQGGFPGRREGLNGNQRRREDPEIPGSAEDGPVFAQTQELRIEPTNDSPLNTEMTLLMDESYMATRYELDFSQYADMEILEDGEAKQDLRRLQDGLQVAQEEHLLAQDRIDGQRRLEARGFITPTELEAEELNLSKARNKEAEQETALKLYIQYTFPKDAEQKLSDYENAIMAYQRQLKENVAEKAQEEARFSSAERKFNLERVKLADIEEQISFSTIFAERPGLVVYGAADQNQMRYRGSSSQEAIQEGATVRQRQAILTIPDMREMAVKTNIHESAVQRVGSGQSVRVSIDAFPDASLTGVVTKVAVVADSANAFMNPDLKVYPTTIKINGIHEWLRPGMSAEVEILVDHLEDIIYVPLQAVTYWNDKRVVYVENGGSPERRDVETGAFSDSFIEITTGLREGEKVLLLPPQQSLTEIGA